MRRCASGSPTSARRYSRTTSRRRKRFTPSTRPRPRSGGPSSRRRRSGRNRGSAEPQSRWPTRHHLENAMKLYEFAPTRSIRVRWTLQELGIDFEAIPIDLLAGEHRSPAFLKINPAGKLPVLVDADMVLTESVAIVVYLADKYRDKGLIPADLQQRAQLMRW